MLQVSFSYRNCDSLSTRRHSVTKFALFASFTTCVPSLNSCFNLRLAIADQLVPTNPGMVLACVVMLFACVSPVSMPNHDVLAVGGVCVTSSTPSEDLIRLKVS